MTITTNKLVLALAAELNGREYMKEITQPEAETAKRDGLVVVFGYSDDNVEFRGAIYDEIGAYEGTSVALTKAGLVENDCENDACPHYKRAKAQAVTIKALWAAEPDYSWTYKTVIPHATFEIVRDGQPYCRGIVFALEEVPA